jgi:hypothetical protein
MNDQTGIAQVDAIQIASSSLVPAGDRMIDHATLPRNAFRDLDRVTAAALARMTGGLSPAALWLAFTDWAIHLGGAPGTPLELSLAMWQDWVSLFGNVTQVRGIATGRPLSRRGLAANFRSGFGTRIFS